MKQFDNRMQLYFQSVILLFTLFVLAQQQISQFDLIITPTSNLIQETTTYKFQIDIVGDGATTTEVMANSDLYIYFPSQYDSFSSQLYPCSLLASPISINPITCSMGYNIMKITGIFSTSYTILPTANDIIRFAISNILNPSYAQRTNTFRGEVKSNNTQLFTFQLSNYVGIVISSGSLTVKMSVSPNTADSTSTLYVTVSPTHLVPSSGILKITLNSYWTTAVDSSANTVGNNPLCVGQNNTAANLYCSYSAITGLIYIKVNNIYTNTSNSPFSFSIYPFTNPPTTQQIGSFLFQLYNSISPSALLIDTSASNYISGIIPSIIQNPKLYLSNYGLGTTVQANISLIITNNIAATDVYYITTPAEIDVSNVQSVSIAGMTSTAVSVLSNNLISFSLIPLSSPYPVNITIQSLILPAYATTISSPFKITIKRNDFAVCEVQKGFNILLIPGSIVATMETTNAQAGEQADYTFHLIFQHAISGSSQIQFYFSSSYFSIGSSIRCSSSLSVNCSLVSSSNNIVKITSVTLSLTSTVTIILRGITNPSSIGNFTSTIINTYSLFNTSYFALDSNSNSSFFELQARPLALNNFNITSNSYIVYGLASYTFKLQNNNYLPVNSYIWIVFPAQIIFSSISCSVLCITGIYNGNRGLQLQQIGPINAGVISTFVVNNLINPTSTKPTSNFQVYIINSQNKVLQYLSAGPAFQALQPSLLSLSFSATSNKNSEIGWFNVTMTPSFSITQAVTLVLTAPSSQGCPLCPSQSVNSSFNQMIFTNQIMSSGTFSLALNNFINHYSYQPITLFGAILSNDLLFNYANGSFRVTNSQPSSPSFVHSFTIHQFSSLTDLTITNLTSATQSQRISQIMITFGSDFILSSSSCSNIGYTSIISGNQVTFTVTNQSNLPSITIYSILTPTLSPSTSVTLSTYSSSGYLIDQNSIIVWTVKCQLPCRTCLISNSSYCQSCYSNIVIAQSRIFYFAVNNTCVSDCGDQYYRNYTTNSCLACSSQCLNCYNYTYCTSCQIGQYILQANTTCYSICPNGYFTKAGQCIECTSILHCYTCINELTCSSCEGRFLYQLQCLSQCPINITTVNLTTNTCINCPVNCSTCQLVNSTVICTACNLGLLDAGKCVSSCQTLGFVPNGLICSACDRNCLTCQNTIYFCLTCNTSSAQPYFLSNKCYSICPNTHYRDNNTFNCLLCTKPCQTCLNYSSNSCTSCISSYSLMGFICQSNCSAQYYSNGSSCIPCNPPCLTCQSATLCFTCTNNYSFFSSNYSCLSLCPSGYVKINQNCVQCSSNCLTCSALTVCLTCHSNSYLLNGNCINPCSNSFFANTTLQICIACPYSCSLCLNSSFCSSCLSGYELQTNNSCISQCLSNQIPINGICQNCNSNCSSCRSTINNCSSCIVGYKYVVTQNSCYSNCPSAFYYYPTNQTCLTNCPSPSYYLFDNLTNISTCFNCPQYCTSCVSSSQCGGCQGGTYSYLALCYSVCPVAALYSFNYACQSCNVIDCQTCSGSDCIACKSGKLLIGVNFCISSCSTGQIYDIVNKSCDTIPSNSGGGGSGTSSSSSVSVTSTQISLNFIPMPLLILYLIAAILIGLLHFKNKLTAIPTLLGTIGPLFTLDCLVIIIVAYATNSITSAIIEIAIYLIICGLLLIFGINGLCFYLRYKTTQCQKQPILCIGCIHYAGMALFTANIQQYNSYFIDQHKAFWKKYKLISKIALFLYLLFLIAGIILAFAVSDHSNYIFYAGIQLCLFAFFIFLLSLAWIWLPIQQPPQEMISDKSTQNIQNHTHAENLDQSGINNKVHTNQKDHEDDEKDNEDDEKELPNNLSQNIPQSEKQNIKLRKDEIKSQGNGIAEITPEQSKALSNFEFNDINQVVKVKTGYISEAIEKGLFRKSEQQILKEIKESQDLSNIEDAAKLNNFIQTKKQTVSNIFEQMHEDDDPFEKEVNQQQKQIYSQENGRQIVQNDAKSSDAAMFNEPVLPKEEDFYHNIIFEQDDEENLTFYEGDNESEGQQNMIINRTPSLGTIMADNLKIVKVKEKEQQCSENIFDNTKENIFDQQLQVVDFEDYDQPQKNTKIFDNNARSRIKPMLSKHLSKKQQPKPIIHADFEQIITVSDGGSMQELDDDIHQYDSSRKIIKEKPITEQIIDIEDHLPLPSSILRQASIHYQPEIQKNLPPKQKSKTVVRGLRRRS